VNLMLVFLFGCIALGMWAPAKRQIRWLVGILTVLLITYFLLSPAHL
jgi:hypothetical protein